jgi:hypothetical protein
MNISKISKPHIQHQENQGYRLILILKSNHPQNLWSQQFAPSCHWLTTVRKNRESAIATTHSSKFMITIICTVSSLTKNNAQRHISRNGNALLKNYNHKITLSRHWLIKNRQQQQRKALNREAPNPKWFILDAWRKQTKKKFHSIAITLRSRFVLPWSAFIQCWTGVKSGEGNSPEDGAAAASRIMATELVASRVIVCVGRRCTRNLERFASCSNWRYSP